MHQTQHTSSERRTSGRLGATSQTIEEAIRRLAAPQHGVVTRRQLLRAGLTPHQVKRRAATGRLRRLHRGVYLAGSALSPHARKMAAALACGPGAVVSHRSAAELWGLLSPRGKRPPVDVTFPRIQRCRRRGVRSFRVRELPATDVTRVEGLPVTTVSRTIRDLAARAARPDRHSTADPRDVEQALARAVRRDLVDPSRLLETIEGSPKRAGAPLLRSLLRKPSGPAFTRSTAEDFLLDLLERGGLPDPETNTKVVGHNVDAVFWAEKLVVEVDGFRFHSSRNRFEEDRRRDQELAAAGFRVLRVTWRQLTEEPHATLVLIAQTLVRAEAEGSGKRTTG